jgi:NAD(P)-dependent dehydrogenase (short-subunit alcohol dehydrogenase family)
VIGRPDPEWGEVVVAYVVGEVDRNELDALCLNNIARFKRPKDYVFVSSLPKNNYGKSFAREGARVFCADINPDAAEETAGIIRSEGGEAVAHRADVSNTADVIAMVEVCASAYGRIDVLDNNVGIAELGGVVEVSEADWDRVFAVNLKSAYLTMKQVIPLMVGQGGGSIINISSIASIRYTGVPYATYYATKAALNQLRERANDHI